MTTYLFIFVNTKNSNFKTTTSIYLHDSSHPKYPQLLISTPRRQPFLAWKGSTPLFSKIPGAVYRGLTNGPRFPSPSFRVSFLTARSAYRSIREGKYLFASRAHRVLPSRYSLHASSTTFPFSFKTKSLDFTLIEATWLGNHIHSWVYLFIILFVDLYLYRFYTYRVHIV